MSESNPPRLVMRRWDGRPPVMLIWIPDLGVAARVVAGSAELRFNHEQQLVSLSDEDAAELLAMYGVPTTRQVDAVKHADEVTEADIAWDLRALTKRCIYDFGLTKLWHSRHRSLSLQHVNDFEPNAASFCRRDADCDGSNEGHVWLMVQPAGITPPFYIWHINLRNGAAAPPTPLRIE